MNPMKDTKGPGAFATDLDEPFTDRAWSFWGESESRSSEAELSLLVRSQRLGSALSRLFLLTRWRKTLLLPPRDISPRPGEPCTPLKILSGPLVSVLPREMGRAEESGVASLSALFSGEVSGSEDGISGWVFRGVVKESLSTRGSRLGDEGLK